MRAAPYGRDAGPARSRARTEYVLSAEGDGTRFDYRNEFHAPLGPVGAIVSRALVGGMPEREAKRTLERAARSPRAGDDERIGVRSAVTRCDAVASHLVKRNIIVTDFLDEKRQRSPTG